MLLFTTRQVTTVCSSGRTFWMTSLRNPSTSSRHVYRRHKAKPLNKVLHLLCDMMLIPKSYLVIFHSPTRFALLPPSLLRLSPSKSSERQMALPFKLTFHSQAFDWWIVMVGICEECPHSLTTNNVRNGLIFHAVTNDDGYAPFKGPRRRLHLPLKH